MQTFQRKTSIIVALLLILILGLSTVWAQAADNTPGAPGGVQAVTGTAFTYQGRLDKSGSPYTGTCNFKFTLYDAASGGTTASSTLTRTGIAVSDGLFTTDLDFGANIFQGDARYLQIQVQCSGDSGYTTLSGRVALTAAPYALGLVPGVTVTGSDTGGSIFSAINGATTGSGSGLYGLTNAAGGNGVSGWNLASSGGTGVYGNTAASAGTPYGVYGIASDSGSATSYGVYGKSNSSAGSGVGGIAPTNGVVGEASDTTGTTWGVFGRSNSASGYGVFGTNTNASGVGIGGETVNGHAVEGTVDWTQSGTGVGVYGSGGFYGNAGVFENATTGNPTVIIQNSGGGSSPALVVTGTTHIEGGLTWKPVTSYVSIPAAAFRPYLDGYAFTNSGHTLTPADASSLNYLAEVQLPHGATITNFTFYWTDGASVDGAASLYRINLNGTESFMASASTIGGGPGSSTTASSSAGSISYATVDNSQYQ